MRPYVSPALSFHQNIESLFVVDGIDFFQTIQIDSFLQIFPYLQLSFKVVRKQIYYGFFVDFEIGAADCIGFEILAV
jgi:hypothetical protein